MSTERDLTLKIRDKATRDKRTIPISTFKIDEILEHFNINVQIIKNQFKIAQSLINNRQNSSAELSYML